MKDIVREEHQLWKDLCQQLLELKAVTDQDLHSRVSEKKTPGQLLLRKIRKWGDTRALMMQERGSL